jgi:hypothetical protein
MHCSGYLTTSGLLIDFCKVLNEGEEPENFFWVSLVGFGEQRLIGGFLQGSERRKRT